MIQGPVPVINPPIVNIALIPVLPVAHFHAATLLLTDSALEPAFLVIDFQTPVIILTDSSFVPALPEIIFDWQA